MFFFFLSLFFSEPGKYWELVKVISHIQLDKNFLGPERVYVY